MVGKDNASQEVFIVGAHYDSDSSDPEHAPGSTDNGCGVAAVLELARVMSTHTYNHTLVFAFCARDKFRGDPPAIIKILYLLSIIFTNSL